MQIQVSTLSQKMKQTKKEREITINRNCCSKINTHAEIYNTAPQCYLRGIQQLGHPTHLLQTGPQQG